MRLRHRAIIAAAVAIGALTLMAPAEASARARPRIALVESAGATGQRGLGRDLHDGFIRAASDVGFRPSVFIVGPGQDPLSEIGRVVDRRFDLIVLALATPSLPQIVAEAAAAFPHARMLVPELEMSALAATCAERRRLCLPRRAAELSRGLPCCLDGRPASGRHDISAVGGVPLPVVKRFLAGYAAGARAEDPRIRVLDGLQLRLRRHPEVPEPRPAADRERLAGRLRRGRRVRRRERSAQRSSAAHGGSAWTSTMPRSAIAFSRACSSARASHSRTSCAPSGRGGSRPGARTSSVCVKGPSASGKLSPAVPAGLRRTLERLRAAIAAGRLHVAAS